MPRRFKTIEDFPLTVGPALPDTPAAVADNAVAEADRPPTKPTTGTLPVTQSASHRRLAHARVGRQLVGFAVRTNDNPAVTRRNASASHYSRSRCTSTFRATLRTGAKIVSALPTMTSHQSQATALPNPRASTN